MRVALLLAALLAVSVFPTWADELGGAMDFCQNDEGTLLADAPNNPACAADAGLRDFLTAGLSLASSRKLLFAHATCCVFNNFYLKMILKDTPDTAARNAAVLASLPGLLACQCHNPGAQVVIKRNFDRLFPELFRRCNTQPAAEAKLKGGTLPPPGCIGG